MRLPPQQYVVLRCFTVLFALLHQKDALNTASCSPYQARGTASSSLPVDRGAGNNRFRGVICGCALRCLELISESISQEDDTVQVHV
ncbi:hypothetical protein Y032_0008g25 [Ancylostoma ceylanicum]|uniref:Secreted protein n=1 Tax=Ancylostoma ceylanicum TaxID=53326 RepID=A0A016VJW4_9BILA|nr:hypothetical protein Y032_0008g25 [Ancylostoma ceylanicum]